jgi:predicted enzyme related to lactoylglutathione lyase
VGRGAQTLSRTEPTGPPSAAADRVLGIGGIFIRARDPAGLGRWYAEQLGIRAMVIDENEEVWWPRPGPTVFSPFPADTDYFGNRDQQVMLNYRVADLDAVLARLRAAGVSVEERTELLEGIGRFGWATDPEGNRFELWEPAPEALTPPR